MCMVCHFRYLEGQFALHGRRRLICMASVSVMQSDWHATHDSGLAPGVAHKQILASLCQQRLYKQHLHIL